MKPFIRRATGLDAVKIASRLRPEDARELETAHPKEPLWHILSEATERTESYILAFNPEFYEPCVLFGIGTQTLGVKGPYRWNTLGVPWMVCTPDVKGHAISIIREARHWFKAWSYTRDLLMNCVESRNELHVRWLKAMGIRFGDPTMRNGVEVLPFYY